MIVCHCAGVSDREIRRAIRNGAHTAREVGLACNAARACGGCRPLVLELLATETPAREDAPRALRVHPSALPVPG